MNIKNRIERLESKYGNTSQLRPFMWNLENVTTAELIDLRDLIDRDPSEALLMQNRLIEEGRITYEYQESN